MRLDSSEAGLGKDSAFKISGAVVKGLFPGMSSWFVEAHCGTLLMIYTGWLMMTRGMRRLHGEDMEIESWLI